MTPIYLNIVQVVNHRLYEPSVIRSPLAKERSFTAKSSVFLIGPYLQDSVSALSLECKQSRQSAIDMDLIVAAKMHVYGQSLNFDIVAMKITYRRENLTRSKKSA